MTAIEHGSDDGRTIGAGTAGRMGRGIARVAPAAGPPVRLRDPDGERAAGAVAARGARLGRPVGKGRMDAVGRDAARARLRAVDGVRWTFEDEGADG
ncbi:3-hydroxyacyl-CoA dehydrogenase NAD-binding domain-containing protein [Streptomyces sp. NPDC058953]|uniref:3-hydroxyacyl-CoA dehydrogenase NAD-binding domain-containing protein n=1 Tax=Streptomyces sp. NPDC058953 TaxID=3346676 RepID=UPI00369092DD